MLIRKISYILLLACLLLVTAPLYGQIIYGSPASANLQLYFSSWNITGDSGKTKIEQWMMPVSGFVPIRDNFEARFYIAGSSNHLVHSGVESNLKGLSDFRILVSHSFYDDRLLASAGLNLPTGKRNLDRTVERAIIETLSENYLAFPLRRLGEGFGFNLLLGAATITGPVKLGAGIAYQYNGSYEPYRGLAKYDPGDYYSINGSGDLKIGNVTITSNIIYTNYTTDKQNGIKAFKQSPQIDFETGGLLKAKSYSLSTNVRYLFRGRHTRYDVQGGDILNRLKMYGDEFSILGRLTYHPAETWSLAPSLEMKLIAANEGPGVEYCGNSSIIGFGGDFGIRISNGFDFALGLKYYTGSTDGGSIDLSGFQLTSSLLAAF